MALQYLPRVHFLLASLMLAIAFAHPGIAAGADAVEKAFNLAKELANKSEASQETSETTLPETDASSSEQATYPGIKNMHIERGGNGVPSISIYYPSLGVPEVDAKLKEFAENVADSYEQDLRESYEDNEEKPDSYGTWEETGFFSVERPNPDIISVTFNIYSYSGGAHGQLLINVQNYDLRNGKQLDFNDLFSDPHRAITILSELTAAKLRASLGEDVEEDMLKDGTAPDPANFANISLLADGVSVEFQPYQVGPWSIGQQHVDVNLAELAPAGPSPLVWPRKSQNADE